MNLRRLLGAFAALLLSAAAARAADAPAIVLFDEAHGQKFTVSGVGELDLSGLGKVFQKRGFVVSANAMPFRQGSFDTVRAVVISGPFTAIEGAEAAALAAFVEKGGRVAVMLHIPFPVFGLLHALGVAGSKGVLMEREGVIDGNPTDFAVRRLVAHPLMAGIDHFDVHGAWGVGKMDGRSEVIASTGATAWIETTGDRAPSPGEGVGSIGVVAVTKIGKGEVAVFGDDAIFQNKFLVGDNATLARNLATWLYQ